MPCLLRYSTHRSDQDYHDSGLYKQERSWRIRRQDWQSVGFTARIPLMWLVVVLALSFEMFGFQRGELMRSLHSLIFEICCFGKT